MNLLFVSFLIFSSVQKNSVESIPTPSIGSEESTQRNPFSNGRCQGRYYDYKISIDSASKCAQKCKSDAHCFYFSYKERDAVSSGSGPNDQTCRFYACNSCDLDNLLETDGQWVSGPFSQGTFTNHPCPSILPSPRVGR